MKTSFQALLICLLVIFRIEPVSSQEPGGQPNRGGTAPAQRPPTPSDDPGPRPPEDAPPPHADMGKPAQAAPGSFSSVAGPWIAQGPTPIANGQVEGITNGYVCGAIHAVAAHPTDVNTVYIGAVNGGVWKTTNATAANPTWTTTTASMASLSIGALAFDPLDATNQTVWAGTGRFSSFSRLGGSRSGLLKTTDGGANWVAVDGGGTLVGKNISGLVVRGNTILVSVNTADSASNPNLGVWRSTDGGTTFTQMAVGNGATTGLPEGVCYDIASSTAAPNTVYTSIALPTTASTRGFFKSTDLGATWTRVSTAEIESYITTSTSNIEFGVGSSNNVLAGIVEAGAPVAIFSSANGGTTWTKMDLPTMPATAPTLFTVTNATNASPIVITTSAAHGLSTNDYVEVGGVAGNTAANGVFQITFVSTTSFSLDFSAGNGAYGGGGTVQLVTSPNPRGSKGPLEGAPDEIAGGQGSIHFSILADPGNANLVYLGGDRQDDPFTNYIGANNYSGNLWRGDTTLAPNGESPSSQWKHLTHSNSVAGIPGGGTSNNSSPHADSRDMTFDAGGNLIEVDDGGIFRRTNPRTNTGAWTSMAGNLQITESHNVAYDTVSNIIFTGNQDNGTSVQNADGSSAYTAVSTADGGDVSVSVNPSNSSQSIRYSSFQNLGSFRRRVMSSTNTLVSQTFPALTPLGGAPSISGQFTTPVEINTINANRLIIGASNGVYESTDQGSTVSRVSTLSPTDGGSGGRTMIYGGRIGGSNNPELIYFADGSAVYRRVSAGGAFTALAGYSGGTVRGIVADPEDYDHIFAIDNNQVFRSTDGGTTFTDITGDIPATAKDFRCLEFIRTGAAWAVVVGTLRGVYAARYSAVTDWAQVGTDLPNAYVWDMDYDAADNLLVAGTLGRGAWKFNNASNIVTDGLPLVPEIVVEQPAGTGVSDGVGTQTFGLVPIGGSAVLTFTVSNVGGDNLMNLLVTKDGAHNADFTVSPLLPTTLAPGASTTFTVTLMPGGLGVRNAAIHIASNDGDENPFDVSLTGTGYEPEIAVEQPEGTGLTDGTGTIAFGNVFVGATTTRRVAIKNAGSGPLTLTSATVDGANAAEFTTGALSTLAVPVNGTAYVDVRFSPQSFTAKTAALHIWSNDLDESPFDIALTGTGTTASGPIALIRDINRVVSGLSPTLPVVIGSVAFFQGTTVNEGVELWRTDGTALGTFLVRDIFAGTSFSTPSNLINFNGTLFFTANNGTNGIELWKSDGTTAGTVLVKDIFSGGSTSSPANLTVVGSTLFFTANDGTNGTELWKSDGTTAGTVIVKDIVVGSTGSSPTLLRNVNGTLFFTALSDGVTDRELWKSDGTSTGTVLVKDIVAGSTGSSPANLTALGSTLLFTVNDGTNGVELWASDGTGPGTALLKDINPGTNSSSPGNLTVVGSTLFFSANDGTNGTELWKSDGTPAGTVLVENISSGSATSSPGNFREANGLLYFSATDGSTGLELWKSDGTAGGTVLVADIVPGGGASSPSLFTAVGGTVYFTALGDGATDRELWKTDGTAGGTMLVRDINPGAAASALANLLNLAGTLIFSANDGLNGQELWKSDGTAIGTVPILDGQSGTNSANVLNLRAVGSTVFFSANDGVNGQELWKSDGTLAGTALVKDIASGASSSSPSSLTNIGSTLYFSAFDTTNGTELWKSDGTGAGTALVANIASASTSSSPSQLTPVGSTLFFSANNVTNGSELWKSDGTGGGTALVKDINSAGNAGSSPGNLTSFNGILFFSANDGTSGIELWKSDGTVGGTVLVKDINPGTGSSSPGNFRVIGSTLLFTANNGTNGIELWKSDGTDTGTVLVLEINAGSGSSSPGSLVVIGSTLFFSASDGAVTYGTELWKSDGTPGGTTLVKDIFPGTGSSTPLSLANVGGTLFFRAFTSAEGNELWKSDGTGPGTVLVSNINPGTASSSPSLITDASGVAYMNATTAAGGVELWKSDGTGAGTMLVADLMPGATSSNPANLTVAGYRLFFTARAPDLGLSELFVVDTTPPAEIVVEQPVGTGLADGTGSRSFGDVTLGTNAMLTFTVRNIGVTDLINLDVTRDGTNFGDFTLGPLGATTLASGASTTFTVTFAPGAAGVRNAAIHIASSDGDENPFDIALTGTGLTRLESWRFLHFGSTSNSGPGANSNDFEFDGLSNFIEFCIRTNPTQPSLSGQSLVRNGANLEFTYQRAKAAVLDGVVFSVEWIDNLTLTNWSTTGVSEMILSDDGVTQQVKATLPAGASGRRWVHLKMVGQ